MLDSFVLTRDPRFLLMGPLRLATLSFVPPLTCLFVDFLPTLSPSVAVRLVPRLSGSPLSRVTCFPPPLFPSHIVPDKLFFEFFSPAYSYSDSPCSLKVRCCLVVHPPVLFLDALPLISVRDLPRFLDFIG